MDRYYSITGGRHFHEAVRAVDDVDVRLRVQHLRVVVPREQPGQVRQPQAAAVPPQMHVGDGVAVRVGGRRGQRAAPPTGSEQTDAPERVLAVAEYQPRRVAVLRFV